MPLPPSAPGSAPAMLSPAGQPMVQSALQRMMALASGLPRTSSPPNRMPGAPGASPKPPSRGGGMDMSGLLSGLGQGMPATPAATAAVTGALKGATSVLPAPQRVGGPAVVALPPGLPSWLMPSG